MKKTKLKFILLGLSFSILTASAQMADLANVLKAGAADASTLGNAYAKPLAISLGSSMAGGWYNTAATHKILGFDLTFGGTVVMPPAEDKTFTVPTTTGFHYEGATTDKIPTIMGSGESPSKFAYFQNTPNGVTVNSTDPLNPKLNFTEVSTKVAEFPLKGGLPMMGSPYIQLGVGLPFKTDIMVRYFPSVNVSGASFNYWGFGIKHEFKQWIPVVKDLPFDASFVFGYTKMTFAYALDVQPTVYNDLAQSNGLVVKDLINDASYWKDQKIQLTASAWNADVVISKSLLFITPYIGLGMQSASVKLDILGNYPIAQAAIMLPAGEEGALDQSSYIKQIKEAIVADPNNYQAAVSKIGDKALADSKTLVIRKKDVISNIGLLDQSKSMMHATVGLRIKLLILTLHAQYTLQPYSMISGGLGFSIR